MTKRQYAPREQAQRAGTQSRLAFPGSAAGAIRNAYPIHKADRTAVRVPTSTTLSAETFWVEDHFTVTSTSPGTFALSYVPRTNSEDITVNGVTLLPTTEWTRSGVTLTVDAGVWLGLNPAYPWDLLVQYEVAAAVAAPVTASFSIAGLSQYIQGGGGTTVTMSSTPGTSDIGLLAIQGDSGPVSGGFTTWTQLRNGATSDTLDIWMGSGGGTGTTVNVGVTAGRAVLSVLPSVLGIPTVAAVTSLSVSGAPNPLAAPVATAAVGDLVLSAVRCQNVSLDRYYPDGTHTDTGFTGTYDRDYSDISFGNGVAVAIGIATGTTVGSSFGTATVSGGGTGEAVNMVLSL